MGGRLLLAAAIYFFCTLAYFACAAKHTLVEHTPYNHFALLARAWLDGFLYLPHGPPSYSGNNDFASFNGRTYVVFPPFPALLILPFVWLAGRPENVQDGQFFLWLAGIAPACLFLSLDKLRRLGFSSRTQAENVGLVLLFAFGTVYFFSAEQGTVWYAAHVVGAGLCALYLLFSLQAERPLLSGVALGLAFATRAPLLLAAPLFVMEALRCSRKTPLSGSFSFTELVRHVEWWVLIRKLSWFALPLVVVLSLTLIHNQLRFDSPFDFGYQHLQVAWQKRMLKWGLFDYHYLAKNLGVILTSLPYKAPPGSDGPAFVINAHGLALWFTTPAYLWLLWPKNRGYIHWALVLSALLVALPSLFYQNTGWIQFGYRFSNDYAVFLFGLLAVGCRALKRWFIGCAAFCVIVNAFGALTFARQRAFYYVEGSQRVLYQPD